MALKNQNLKVKALSKYLIKKKKKNLEDKDTFGKISIDKKMNVQMKRSLELARWLSKAS